jgi:hypothetical protein
MNAAIAKHFLSKNSKAQEQFAEYAFLRDVLFEASSLKKSLVVSRSDYDAFGYDLLFAIKDKIATIQMKATGGKTRGWDVHKSLLNSKYGQVIYVKIEIVNNDLITKYFLYDKRHHAKTALKRKPKVEHTGKCRIHRSHFIEMKQGNILSMLF